MGLAKGIIDDICPVNFVFDFSDSDESGEEDFRSAEQSFSSTSNNSIVFLQPGKNSKNDTPFKGNESGMGGLLDALADMQIKSAAKVPESSEPVTQSPMEISYAENVKNYSNLNPGNAGILVQDKKDVNDSLETFKNHRSPNVMEISYAESNLDISDTGILAKNIKYPNDSGLDDILGALGEMQIKTSDKMDSDMSKEISNDDKEISEDADDAHDTTLTDEQDVKADDLPDLVRIKSKPETNDPPADLNLTKDSTPEFEAEEKRMIEEEKKFPTPKQEVLIHEADP